ncbi:MAG TPA: hypothetical protein VJL80_09920 [Aeromicrobium sp.]|nr:hypothetical protein [Aeromicrobium sp.]HKY58343.1 hypothetical protein [Aeromicrobium sp.]
MDLTDSIAPKSDQLNAEDLLSGPRTFTIAEVREGSAEQPVNVHLVEFPGRPFRPSKTVRRIMVAAWGKDSSAYVGRRMTLFRDPAVRFGGQDVGGIRVSHMSHIEKRLTIALTVTRGKRAPYVVEPLVEKVEPSTQELAAQVAEGIKGATTEAEIREWGNRAHARGLLDVQVEGQVLRDHVTEALAVLAEQQPTDVIEGGEQA